MYEQISLLKTAILPIIIIGISIVVITSWIFVVVPELKHSVSAFEIINQRVSSDRIVTEIGEELPEQPIRTADRWNQEVINQEGNNLEIRSTITTTDLRTLEIIFESESVFLIDKYTRTHIEDPEKFFMFPINVQKKTYEFIHPLIYFPAKFVFEGEDEIDGLLVYIFSCNTSTDDISYAYSQFSQKILSDSTCRVWVEPITGIELWFEKTWHDYHQDQNQIFSVDKGSSETTEFARDVLIDATSDRIKLYTFYDTVIPIFLAAVSAGSVLVAFINQILRTRTKELIETRRKKTEEVLYEVIPDFVVTLDKNNRIVNCNEKLIDKFGYLKDEIIGKNAADFIIKEERKKYSDLLKRIKNGEQVMEYDLHIKRKDGSIGHLIWNSIPMYDENKEYIGYMSTGVDLTEIDKLRDELVEKELMEAKRMRIEQVLFEVIPDCVVTFDKNNRLEDCNKIFVDELGFSKDELIGMNAIDFLVEKDRKKASEVLQRIIKGETIIEIDFHGKRKDGSVFHSIWNAIPMFDNNNDYIGFVSTGVSLSKIDESRDELVRKEKLEQEKELIKAKKKKTEEVLFETIPNPVITFDQNNKVIDCNQYYLDKLGFSRDEIFRISAPDFLTEESMKIYRDVILPSLNEGKPLMDIDLHIKKKDGSIFHALWSHIRNLDENNEYLGFTAIGLDLTEIDKLSDELAKKEKFEILGQLAANLAHDIKNPLNTIKQSSEIIQLKTNQEKTQKDFQRIGRSITRISHQVDQVLNYIKKTPLVTEDTTVLKILKQSLDIITIPDNITIEIPKKNSEVKWDETKISVLFVNIILNAIQAIDKDKGKISIRTAQESDSIKIEIENTGPNIPEKDLDKIFEPLYTTKMEGTGLGLAGCKNILQSHKGTITVSNNPVIFTIKIPKFL